MSAPGDVDLLVAARAALLDALDALVGQRDALVLIGAQAIYLHTGAAPVALAEATKDSDLAVDPRALSDDPLLDDAMTRAGFHRDLEHPQPGAWLSREGIPVDLMVPEALAGGPARRGARIPPHSRHATRRTRGLEAAVVDHAPMTITALDPRDRRHAEIAVAGPAALLVAKLHKLGERKNDPGRLVDKDAHDITDCSSPSTRRCSDAGYPSCAMTRSPERPPRRRSRTYAISSPLRTPWDRRWPAAPSRSWAIRPSSAPRPRCSPRTCSRILTRRGAAARRLTLMQTDDRR